MRTTSGFFVDWDGKTRAVGTSRDGVLAQVARRNGRLMVEVVDGEGFVAYEADLHEDLASIEAAGVTVEMI